MQKLKLLSAGILTMIFIAGCISPELRSARIAVNERDWQRALSQIELELSRMPGSPEALYLKGYCYEKLGDYGKMSQWFDSSLARSNSFSSQINETRRTLVGRYYRRFLVEYDSSRWNEALNYIDTAIVINPHDIELYQQATIAAYYGDDYDKASTYAEKALKLETPTTRDVSIREVLLVIANNRKDHEKSIHWAQELMSLVDPTEDSSGTYLRAFDVLVGTYEEKGDYDAAEKAIADVARIFPGRTDIKMNLALTMLRKENYTNAKLIYQEVLKYEPENFDANLNLGTILVNESMWLESIPYLEKAHQLDPKNRIAVQNLMAAYFNSDQVEAGLKMKEKLDALQDGN